MTWNLEDPATFPITVKQHLDRLKYLEEHQEELGIYYDADAAVRPENFIERNLVLYEGEWSGKPFILDDWQKRLILRPLFGWKLKNGGTRLFRQAYIQLPRGSGKSALNAAILLYFLLFESKGQKNFCIGPNSKTARQVFTDAVEVYRASPNLHKFIEIQGETTDFITDIHTLKHPRSSLNPQTASALNEGVRFGVCSIDELHRHPNANLLNVYRQCASKSKSSLVLIITNAGDRPGVCYDEYKFAKKILSGEMTDWSYFTLVPEPDPEDDPFDIKTLEKVTPCFGSIIEDTQTIIQEMTNAREFSDKRTTYKRFRLNSWVIGEGAASWIDFKKWQEATEKFKWDELRGSDVYLGIDLSKTTDLTAISMLIDKNGKLYLHSYPFMPRDTIYNETAYPFAEWLSEGYLEEGDAPEYRGAINYELIFEKIAELNESFTIKAIGLDPALAGELKRILEDNGYQYIDVPQSAAHLSDTTNELQRLLYNKILVHDSNPLLDWCIQNCKTVNVNGLTKIIKVYQQSAQRIDPIIAAIIALNCRIKMIGSTDSEADEYTMSLLNLPKGFSW